MNFTPREDFLVSAFQDDPRLVDMFREAERKRKKPLVNWYAVLGAVICIASAAAVVWGILSAYIHVTRWFS